jgi:hypothetical protein
VRDILTIDGGYMFASAVTTGLLAHGVDPIKVAGITQICFVPILLKFFELNEIGKPWGTLGEIVAMTITGLIALIIVGTLH